jgi:hypothetical protein
LDFKVQYGEDKKMYNRIKLLNDARKIFFYSGNLIFSVPTRLPMIVEPKSYIFNEKKIIKLGGYLNNDNYVTENLFIPKPGYKVQTT